VPFQSSYQRANQQCVAVAGEGAKVHAIGNFQEFQVHARNYLVPVLLVLYIDAHCHVQNKVRRAHEKVAAAPLMRCVAQSLL
jgi:hypothetical protein